MAVAKQLADLLTLSRALIAVGLLWLGRIAAAELLTLAALLLLASWLSDGLDGAMARWSGVESSWIGDHDLELDVLVSLGVLGYLVGARYLAPIYAVGYLALWALAFQRWGWKRDPAMLFQAPIYLWFVLVAMREAPQVGRWLIAYVLAVIIVTWPRFPRQIVPEFLAGMSELMQRKPAGRR